MRWFKRKEICSHFKKAGEKWLENMIEIVRFSNYETDTIGYGISECTVCKKRAFSCMTCHTMSDWEAGIIDAFIAHEMGYNSFKEFLVKHMAWHKEASVSGKEGA